MTMPDDQSILSKAFRGELVPQDPRDEPASELFSGNCTIGKAAEAAKKVGKKGNEFQRFQVTEAPEMIHASS